MSSASIREAVEDLAQNWGEARLEEALSRLELALEDEGWNRLGAQSQFDFSRTGLKKIIELARSMYLSNPLIKNAVLIQTHYVWGQGWNITPKSELIADQVITPFLDSRTNRRELTSHQARQLKEVSLQTDGNLFFALFTNQSTGAVNVRTVPIDQVEDVIKNPEDDHEPWYYLRTWTERELPTAGGTGSPGVKERKAYYPDWLYRPVTRPAKLGDIEVRWDAPIYHVRVGGTDHMTFGVPEVFAALPWARAVVQALEDYASIRRAHARFAWKVNTKGGPKGVAAGKARLATTLSEDTSETNPPAVTGSTWIQSDGGANLEPLKTAGGQASPDEGRRLGLMVSAATGTPETMLFGDSTVGNYATAKSLDRPTELEMKDRQELWASVFGDVLGYVIDQAATKPNGPLKGKKRVSAYTKEAMVDVLDPDTKQLVDRRIDITFPNILERDALPWIQAIVTGFTANGQQAAGLLDPRTATKLILTGLGERDVDEQLAALFPDDIVPPETDELEPGPAINPAEPPADTQLPNPTGPIDSPTAATIEAAGVMTEDRVKELVEVGMAAARPEPLDVKGLVEAVGAQTAEAVRLPMELARQAIDGLADVAEAQSGRPIEVDATTTIAEGAVQTKVDNLVEAPKPAKPRRRRVVRESKFHTDEAGHVTGKTETEVEDL